MPQRRLDTSSWGWWDAGTSIVSHTTCFLPGAFKVSRTQRPKAFEVNLAGAQLRMPITAYRTPGAEGGSAWTWQSVEDVRSLWFTGLGLRPDRIRMRKILGASRWSPPRHSRHVAEVL